MSDTIREHPLKGQFDTATAEWRRTTKLDGTPGKLEVGYADNGLVALRYAEEPDGTILIYTPAEWDAFVEGVKDGEFDIEVLEEDARLAEEEARAEAEKAAARADEERAELEVGRAAADEVRAEAEEAKAEAEEAARNAGPR